MGNPRRTFTFEFRLRAVKMMTEQVLAYRRVASELGFGEGTLRRWAKELDQHQSKAFLIAGFQWVHRRS